MKYVITGSSTGIGRSLAERLLKHAHQVWGIARSDQSDLSQQFPNFRSSRCDVAEWSQVESAANAVRAEWSTIDGLVTCAGIQGEVGPAIATNPLNWSSTVRANLDGTYYAIRGLFSLLAASSTRGKIVCFSGGGATKPRVNFSAYGVAKTGVVRLVETIAEELAGRPIDINAIAPGAINTRLTDEVIALGPQIAGAAEYKAAVEQKRSGGASLDHALDLVEFLLGRDSDGITGRLLSAPWDPWKNLAQHRETILHSDVYTLRRIVPADRQMKFDQ